MVVFAGTAALDQWAYGTQYEDFFNSHSVHLIVGPRWQTVRDVVPLVTMGCIDHPGSDSDDGSGFSIHSDGWDTVGGPDDVETIRVKVILRVRGEYARVEQLNYHVTAIGKLAPGANL